MTISYVIVSVKNASSDIETYIIEQIHKCNLFDSNSNIIYFVIINVLFIVNRLHFNKASVITQQVISHHKHKF